jgi:hypothetical protein
MKKMSVCDVGHIDGLAMYLKCKAHPPTNEVVSRLNENENDAICSYGYIRKSHVCWFPGAEPPDRHLRQQRLTQRAIALELSLFAKWRV